MPKKTTFGAIKKRITDIHGKQSANLYLPENLTAILVQLETHFNAGSSPIGVRRLSGKIAFPHPVGEGVLEIKDALNKKQGLYAQGEAQKGAAKDTFRQANPKVAEYINEYRFKKAQTTLRDIFRTQSADQYEPAELRALFISLEESFSDAEDKKWDSRFFSEVYAAVRYVSDDIETRDRIDRTQPFRHIKKVISALDIGEYSGR